MYYMLWSAKFCFMKWMMCGVVGIFVKPYNRFFGSILLPEKKIFASRPPVMKLECCGCNCSVSVVKDDIVVIYHMKSH